MQLEELLDVATARRIALETEKSALLQAHTETATTLESLSSELDSMRSDIIHERDAHALQIAHLEDVIADRTSSTWLDNDREMDLRTGIEKLQDQLKSTREESDVRATQIVELSSELTASAVKFNDSQNKAASQLKSLLLDHTKEMAILESQRVTALQQLATASSTMALQKEELQLRMDEIVTLKRQFEEIKQSGEAAKNARNQVVRDLESQLQTSTDDLAAMTKLHADLVTSSTAAKLTGDKVIDVLKKQVAENQFTSSATIADLTAQLKVSEDELATLVQNHTQALAAARIAADQQLEAATAQSKHDADAVAALRLRIIELETSLTTSNDELSALAAQRSELMVTRAAADAVNKSIVELEARMKAVIAENELAEDDIAKKSKELAAAADMRADLEGAITGLQATIQKDGDEIAALQRHMEELGAALKQSTGELAAMTKLHADLVTSSTAAKLTGDKVIDVLKKQVAENQFTSSATIADLTAQLKVSEDELATLVQNHTQALAAARIAADQQLEAATAQSKHDADAVAALRMRIIELEASLTTNNDELSALAAQRSQLSTANEAQNELLKQRSAAHEVALADMEHKLQGANAVSEQRCADITRLMDVESTLQSEINLLQARLAEMNQERLDLLALHAEQVSDLEAATWQESSDIEADLAESKLTIAELEQRIDQLQSDAGTAGAQAMMVKDELQKAQELISGMSDNETKLTQSLKSAERQHEIDLSRISTLDQDLAIQKEELQLRMDEIVTLKRQFEEIKQSGEAAKNARNQVVRDLESQLQTSTDDLAAMTKLHADLVTSSTAAKLTGDKVIDVLKKQVAENQFTSSATIADLTAQLKVSEDELATLVQNHTQALAAARIAADQQLEAATAQSKHDADAVAALRLRIIELETSLTTSNDELSALAAQRSELMVTRAAADAVNKSIVELEARMKAVIAENELAEDDIAKKSKELAAAADLRADLERAITGLQATIQKDGDKIASMSGAVADFQSQLARTENERLALHKKYIELTASSAAADMAAAKAIADWEIQCKTNIAALAVATNQHAELTAAKVAADEQLKAWETQIFSLNKQVTDSTSASAVLEVRNHELETQQSILQADIMDFKQQLGGLIKEQHGWERSVRALEQHISALATAREDQELLAREQVAATNRAVAEVSSMRLQVAEAKTNNEAIKAQVTRRLKS